MIISPAVLALRTDSDDDTAFAAQVRKLTCGAASGSDANRIFVVKISGWFGSRWTGFIGKALGAVRLANRRDLRVPPFVPSRVVREQRFDRDGDQWREVAHQAELHISQRSEANHRRRLRTRLLRTCSCGGAPVRLPAEDRCWPMCLRKKGTRRGTSGTRVMPEPPRSAGGSWNAWASVRTLRPRSRTDNGRSIPGSVVWIGNISAGRP